PERDPARAAGAPAPLPEGRRPATGEGRGEPPPGRRPGLEDRRALRRLVVGGAQRRARTGAGRATGPDPLAAGGAAGELLRPAAGHPGDRLGETDPQGSRGRLTTYPPPPRSRTLAFAAAEPIHAANQGVRDRKIRG